MTKTMDSREKVVQRSLGIFFRQLQFLERYSSFNVSKFLREKLDEQIREIDREFLSEEEITKGDK